jgi:glyoxylase-like metal-dependent hydrolase (beta-lactamase superfamily II)
VIHHHVFTFNPLAENTYLLWDDAGHPAPQAVVIDPGCCNRAEREELTAFIEKTGLTVVGLLNTHGHIDHVLGNAFVARTYGVDLQLPAADLPTLRAVKSYAALWGFPDYEELLPEILLRAGDVIRFGGAELEVLSVPGHAPGHVAYVNRAENLCVSGDVLFRGSIGRTDLPGGNYAQLMESIRTQLLPLGDATRVFPGHGPETTIGAERRTNPFLLAEFSK